MSRPPTLRLHLDRDELVVDAFAGGGGASTGIELATGRSPDIAINHDADALAMHARNHPRTVHFVADVFAVDPREACGKRAVGLLWASPDCTYFSKARGSKPHRDRKAARRRRGLAGVVTRWAAAVRPRVIIMENVEEFRTWGPLLADGRPDPKRRGQSFDRWIARLRNMGYAVEWRELRACDFGAPTTRKRLFIVARCDGAPIAWPVPTHGPHRGALSRRRRVHRLDDPDEVDLRAEEAARRGDAAADRGRAAEVRAHARQGEALLRPHRQRGARRAGASRARPRRAARDRHREGLAGDDRGAGARADSWREHANCAGPRSWRATADADDREGEGWAPRARDGVPRPALRRRRDERLRRRRAPPHDHDKDHHALVAAQLALFDGPVEDRGEECEAFLVKYFGNEREAHSLQLPLATVTTKDRFGLVVIDRVAYRIVDIRMRMLTPRELFLAQGFPRTYVIEFGAGGRKLPKGAQIEKCGNSVSPPNAAALVRANLAEPARRRSAPPARTRRAA
jgi:DNA (cytosine-5)-methyltransferase 1